LDPREVRSFTLREAVLAVKLELSGDDRVLSPTMHVQRGLREDEGTGIRDTRVIKVTLSVNSISRNCDTSKIGLIVRIGRTMPVSSETSISDSRLIVKSTSVLEKTISINVSTGVTGSRSRTSKSMDSVRKSIDGISVVERLSTKYLEKKSIASQGRAVINVLIRLNNPDEFLNRVIEVKLDLVRR
jgi:hypothetical protein